MVKNRKGPEGVLRFMLADADSCSVAQRCIAHTAYENVLKRLAEEDSSMGAEAKVVMSFLATREKLIAYTENGGDVAEEFIAELAVPTALGDMLRRELDNRTDSSDEGVQARALQLMDALSVPSHAEDMRRRLSGTDVTGAIAYCGKLATCNVRSLAALNRVAMDGGKVGCAAQAALLYTAWKEFVTDRLRVAAVGFMEMSDVLNYVMRLRGEYLAGRSESNSLWLALQAALEVLADRRKTPEELLAMHLMGIVNDPLRREFFNRLATSSTEDVADWLEGLGVAERAGIAAEYLADLRSESELSRCAKGVLATFLHRMRERMATGEPQTTEIGEGNL